MKRFAAIKWARDVPTLLHNGRVDRLGHHLLLILATYGRNDGSDIWASVNTLAREVHATVGEVEDALERLQKADLLSPAAASNGAPGWSLNLSLAHERDTVVESRLERRRAVDRERKRRQRERARGAGHDELHRDVTQELTVTSVTLLRDGEKGVTQECHDVTQDCHGCHGTDTVTSAGQDGCNSLINSLNSHVLRIEDARPTKTETTPVPEHDPKQSPAKASKKIKKSGGYTPEFEAWWALYPLKKDKHNAAVKFTAARKLVSVDVLNDGAKRYATEVAGRDPEHVKYAKTWLHGRCWENGAAPLVDDVLEWLRSEWQAGRVRPIEERTGLSYVPPDLPLDVTTREQVEAFYLDASREWITAHRDQIIERLTHRSAS